MEQVSGFSFSRFSDNKTQEFFLQSEQDGLFFGLEFVRNFLKTGDQSENFEITAYLQDGDCVFKGQTCLGIHLKNKNFIKENLISLISYFSGVYTLVSCFTEKKFDFSIMASSSPDFPFSEWEEKAILKAGGLIQKCPEDICFCLEDIHQTVEKGKKNIVLSNLKMSKEELKNILKEWPSTTSSELSLQGSFFPSDLEELRFFNLKSVWPICLQGSFPSFKMRWFEF